MPLAFLAFHRLADRPALGRGLMLGIASVLQALACGYYGVFLVTLIGPLIVVTAVTQNLVKNARFWAGLCVAGLTSALIVAPLFAQYMALQRGTGFGRSLENAALFSATWRTYLVSGAYASSWLTDGSDTGAVLFPGFVAGIGGVVGLAIAWRLGGRPRQLAAFYGTLALLAFWLSLGPSGYLYSIAYRFPFCFHNDACAESIRGARVVRVKCGRQLCDRSAAAPRRPARARLHGPRYRGDRRTPVPSSVYCSPHYRSGLSSAGHPTGRCRP